VLHERTFDSIPQASLEQNSRSGYRQCSFARLITTTHEHHGDVADSRGPTLPRRLKSQEKSKNIPSVFYVLGFTKSQSWLDHSMASFYRARNARANPSVSLAYCVDAIRITIPTFRSYVLSTVRLGTITVKGARPLAHLMLRVASLALTYSPTYNFWLSRTVVFVDPMN
jgi:hypothetical protein